MIFYEVSAEGEKWIPLPEKLIMRAREDSERIQRTNSSETFANNQPIETCELCHMNIEECGLMITRIMKEQKATYESKPEEEPQRRGVKRKISSESSDGI